MQENKKTYIAFLIPSTTLLFIFTVFPFVLLVVFSLTSWSLIQDGSFQFFGIGNFFRFAEDARFWNSLKVSFYYIFVNTGLQVLLGFAIALLLFLDKKGIQLLRPLFLVPMLIPPVAVGLCWRVLFTPNLGGINFFLKSINIEGPVWLAELTSALIAVTITSVWEWTPFVMIILLAGLESLSTDLLEAAIINGASWLQLLRYVIIPLLKPVLLVVIILRILESLAILPVVFIMTGGGPVSSTEAINLYADEVGLNFLDISYASTLLIVLIFIMLIFTSVLVKFAIEENAS